MQELIVECQLTGQQTVIRISGDVDSHQYRMLREALDVGYALDPDSQVVVDLTGLHAMSVPGVDILCAAVDSARRAGRTTTVRNLDVIAADGRGLVLQRLLANAPSAEVRPVS